jgi:hypothetical protein
VTNPARRTPRDPGAAFLAFRLAEPIEDTLDLPDDPAPAPEPIEDDLDLADPLLENRLEAAAALARWEERLRVASLKALRKWTSLVSDAVLGDGLTADAGGQEPVNWATALLHDVADRLGVPVALVMGESLPSRVVEYPDGLTAAPADLPPDPNAVAPLSAQWTAILEDMVGSELTAMLGDVFAAVLGEDTTISSRPWVEEYIASVINRLVGVADQTFDVVRDAVDSGISEGMSIPKIRDLVQAALDAGRESSWAGRAETIARTETIAAYNGGHLQAWKFLASETGTTREKVWLATIDRRTRKSHYRADGQRVALDAKFVVGNAQLDHPGDHSAPADEVVSCRCTMMVVDADEETPDTEDRQMRPAGEVRAEIDRRREEDGDVRAADDPDAPSGPRAPRKAPPPQPAPEVAAPATVEAAAEGVGDIQVLPSEIQPGDLFWRDPNVEMWAKRKNSVTVRVESVKETDKKITVKIHKDDGGGTRVFEKKIGNIDLPQRPVDVYRPSGPEDRPSPYQPPAPKRTGPIPADPETDDKIVAALQGGADTRTLEDLGERGGVFTQAVRFWTGTQNKVEKLRREVDSDVSIVLHDVAKAAPRTSTTLHRGMYATDQASHDWIANLKVGDEIPPRVAASFTSDEAHSMRFLGPALSEKTAADLGIEVGDQPFLTWSGLRVRLENGHAVPIESVSNTPYEKEWIVGRTLRVTEVQQVGVDAWEAVVETI